MNAFLKEDAFDDSTCAGVIEPRSSPRPARARTAPAPQVQLGAIIQSHIIPGLVQAYISRPSCAAPLEEVIGPQQLNSFAALVRHGNLSEATTVIAHYQQAGMLTERIFLELLAPTARIYGDLWAADSCDFTEVTVACWRLQQFMQNLSADFRAEYVVRRYAGAILLTAAPGEQHTFGVTTLAEFLRRAGYEVFGDPCSHVNTLFDTVRSQHIDVVGLSVSGECKLKGLARLIAKLRKVTMNRGLRVIVGGSAILADPKLAETISADGWAATAQDALEVVSHWCRKAVSAE